jgi:hypothetical protein
MERWFQRLHEEKINVFCVKTPIEFGMTGELDPKATQGGRSGIRWPVKQLP